MQGKYHLLSISIILTLLYCLSYIASNAGVFPKRIHSQIWNTLLLVSFLVSGVLGFFLVIQINYKIEVPFIKSIMLLHVDFGIALFIISVFHILLHLSYFGNIINKLISSKKDLKAGIATVEESAQEEPVSKPKLVYSILTLGITTIISQIILIREFITAFSGNELLIGITLSNWLILNGIGAYAGQLAVKLKKRLQNMYLVHFLLGILPSFTVFLLYVLKNILFPTGVQINYVQLLLFSFFLLLPLCLVSGFTFSLLSKFLSEASKKSTIHLNYSIESMGSMIGGFLFSFILVFFLRTFQTLFLLFLINVIAIYILSYNQLRIYQRFIFLLISVLLVIPGIVIDIDKYSKAILFPGQDVVSINQSPYGQSIITENEGQLNFYQNGVYILSIDTGFSLNSNIAVDEETVHFAMSQHQLPQHVLCISGGISGIIHEILKYPVKSVDYVEIDPLISNLASTYNPDLKNPKVSIYNEDGREYIRKCRKKYDVLFINLPPPSGTELNRYYTSEFLNIMKPKMAEESYLALSLPSIVNYVDASALLSNKLIFNTLAEKFKFVKIFPGEKNYFIASDHKIETNIVEELGKKGIANEYISYYLDDESIKSRSDLIMQQIEGKSAVNKDLKPLSYLLYIQQQWEIFSGSYWVLLFFFLVILFIIFRKFNRLRFGMFAAGFASISAELMIIYLFQMVFGTAYRNAGIVFAVFMSGLVIGPILQIHSKKLTIKSHLIFTLLIIGVLVAILPITLKTIIDLNANRYVVSLLCFISTFMVAALTGYIFKLSSLFSSEQAEKVAGKIYSADLYGSAIGSLIVSVFVLPVLGVLLSGLPGGILCVVAGILLVRE